MFQDDCSLQDTLGKIFTPLRLFSLQPQHIKKIKTYQIPLAAKDFGKSQQLP